MSTDLRRELAVLVWTLQLRNTTNREMMALTYVPEFLDATGAEVNRMEGLTAPTGTNSNSVYALVSMDRIDLHLRAGEERTLILRELVSRSAAAHIRQARISLTPFF